MKAQKDQVPHPKLHMAKPVWLADTRARVEVKLF
jgi:hypothetical protein